MRSTPVSIHDATAAVRSTHQALIAAARNWLLENGTPLDAEALALVVAAADLDPTGIAVWTRPRVNALLMRHIPNWCSLSGCLRPDYEATAVWRLLDFLAATDRLGRGSDPLDRLREPLMCYGQLGPDGCNPASPVPAAFPCECYLPVADDPRLGAQWMLASGDLIQLWRPAPSEPQLQAWFDPLSNLARRSRAERSRWLVHVDEFDFIGRLDRRNKTSIFVYLHRDARAEVFVDDDGNTYEHARHASSRHGRFKECTLRRAIGRGGLVETLEPVSWPRDPADCGEGRPFYVVGGAAHTGDAGYYADG